MEKVLVLLICALALAGCATNVVSTWNDEDARILARELAADILAGDWLLDFAEQHSSYPTLMICELDNHSGQTIPLQDLGKELSRELLASGKLRMVVPRKPTAEGTDDPAGLDIPIDTSGADVLLLGSLEAIPDPKLLIFRLDLHLLDAQSKALLHRAVGLRQKPLLEKKKRTI
ncbi:MAG: penicillin-binding protein activator LpoB [Candidatus Syntrophosphaera sp.]|nr:penicillin-binding protein activator LpoB [Candidatus Syntrophosphaera sp.]